jgi:hypothetical protein
VFACRWRGKENNRAAFALSLCLATTKCALRRGRPKRRPAPCAPARPPRPTEVGVRCGSGLMAEARRAHWSFSRRPASFTLKKKGNCAALWRLRSRQNELLLFFFSPMLKSKRQKPVICKVAVVGDSSVTARPPPSSGRERRVPRYEDVPRHGLQRATSEYTLRIFDLCALKIGILRAPRPKTRKKRVFCSL